MLASDTAFLAQLLKLRTGIIINPSKTSRIATRLAPVVRRFGFRNADELMHDLRNAGESLVRAVIDAMTTNDTWFFRDRAVFEQFRASVLPELMSRRRRSRSLRFWCAAASTGQEAYTLAMLLHEAGLEREGWKIDILASDISSECIARAQEGAYTSFEVQRGLSVKRLVTYFTQEGQNWRVSESLRHIVLFNTFNLLEDRFAFGEFDTIFCRNVLIYFDQPTKARVLNRLAASLCPGGYLVVGTAEMPHEVTTAFEPLSDARGFYWKPFENNRRAAR